MAQPVEFSMVGADPTQRLLISLGSFYIQVTLAEAGAPQTEWSDAALNQLGSGIEIASDEAWGEIAFALTDIARILQTYTDAGRANESISFLKDGYEILCLMVGHRIVGHIRDDALEKWRWRHDMALSDLCAGGLSIPAEDDPNNPWPAPVLNPDATSRVAKSSIWATVKALFR